MVLLLNPIHVIWQGWHLMQKWETLIPTLQKDLATIFSETRDTPPPSNHIAFLCNEAISAASRKNTAIVLSNITNAALHLRLLIQMGREKESGGLATNLDSPILWIKYLTDNNMISPSLESHLNKPNFKLPLLLCSLISPITLLIPKDMETMSWARKSIIEVGERWCNCSIHD